jgi:hypothetical protein
MASGGEAIRLESDKRQVSDAEGVDWMTIRAPDRIGVLVGVAVIAMLGGCRRPGTGAPNAVTLQRISMALPATFEHKPGTHMYRVRRGSEVIRFLAVDEVPSPGGRAAATLNDLRAALRSNGRVVESELLRQWQGHRAVEVTWRGSTKAGAAVRGRSRFVVLDDAVVSVLWYAPVAEWGAARPEMDAIVDGMRLR